MNVGDEYMGPPATKRYHDTFAKLEGPAVRDAVKDFYEAYAASGGHRVPEAEQVIPPPRTGRGPGTRMRFISRDPKDPEQSIRNTFLTLIDSARERINIETAYFLSDDVVTSLAAAARRGVEVNLITDSGKGYHVPVARKDYQKLLDAGVRIYEYPGLVHTKALSVDGKFATIGSPNFDNISMNRNREVLAVVEDPDWVRKYDEELFKDDMAGDEQGNVTRQLTKIEMPFWKRVGHWIIQWLWPDWAE
jgi:cardiolipin synthase